MLCLTDQCGRESWENILWNRNKVEFGLKIKKKKKNTNYLWGGEMKWFVIEIVLDNTYKWSSNQSYDADKAK